MSPRFHLTGSQAFGSATGESDTDLYAQDSPELRKRLMSEGFRKVRTTGKCGPNLSTMMRKGNRNGPHVDVGLYRSIERKHFESRMAKITPIALVMRYAPKSLREKVWGALQRL